MNKIYHLEIGNHLTTTEYVVYCGERASNHTDCRANWRVYLYHLGPLVGPMYRWLHPSDATCGYHVHIRCRFKCPRKSFENINKPDLKSHGHLYPCLAVLGLNISPPQK